MWGCFPDYVAVLVRWNSSMWTPTAAARLQRNHVICCFPMRNRSRYWFYIKLMFFYRYWIAVKLGGNNFCQLFWQDKPDFANRFLLRGRLFLDTIQAETELDTSLKTCMCCVGLFILVRHLAALSCMTLLSPPAWLLFPRLYTRSWVWSSVIQAWHMFDSDVIQIISQATLRVPLLKIHSPSPLNY